MQLCGKSMNMNTWKYNTLQVYYKINAYYNPVSLTLLQWLDIQWTQSTASVGKTNRHKTGTYFIEHSNNNSK
jgi:hypothetical protein